MVAARIPFDYELGAEVKLSRSEETGQIIGRIEYLLNEPQYQVRYPRADGVQVEEWINQSALTQIPPA